MKAIFRFCLLSFSILVFSNAYGQILNPVKWNFNTKKTGDCEYELIFKAKIDDGWHLYGQKTYGDEGPIPLTFQFTKSPDYELIGKPSESKLIKKFEPMFNLELEFFEHEASLSQKIKLNSDKTFEIKGSLEFGLCDDSKCLPPTTEEFSLKVQGSVACLKEGVKLNSVDISTAKDNIIDSTATLASLDTAVQTAIIAEHPTAERQSTESKTSRAWWNIFLIGFLGGLAALLTPCVFPMIPMTVSFFTKQSKTKAKGISNAFIYGISIIVIYVLLGFTVTKIFGPDALNALSTNVWFNLAFFALLVVFAISFLGAFEITLPSRFVNKMDAQSDRGGLIGIFFMAFTLSLVSFSCTGPIIGTLLVDAAVNGGIKGPFWGMLGFSSALALPFGLFAAFPGWLNSLPKSGGWLNSVKVVLGFLELALALKFASNADLVVQAGILTREVFLVLWIVIFGLMGIYLIGWIKLSHDGPLHHLSVTRLFTAILTFSFTIYLIPGLWGAPLKLISGFPPPIDYSESPTGFGTSSNEQMLSVPEHASLKHGGLTVFEDYDYALDYAKKVGKPLMIDFTGLACVNCRKMEEQVWPDFEVKRRLKDEVVLVSLVVDNKAELPADQQTVKKLGDRDFKIKTIGNKWSYFQASRYNTNAQPQYILLDHNEQMLTKETAHYDPNITKYVDWLDEGIKEFKKRSGK
ncbi:MAG: thioredoxin family protein [Bacteroidetes bacterium]|nr:thioredoxin family protein [Bacteroidota bacterium]